MATTNKSSLEDFIKTYLNNKIIAGEGESYENWVKSVGINSDALYANDIANIDSEYMRAKSEYGVNAERLGQLGINGGYSDYLNGKAYSEMQKSKNQAKDRYLENERKNLSDYSAYKSENESKMQDYIQLLIDEKNNTNKLYADVMQRITDGRITDYNIAFNYAVNAGLDKTQAAALAKTAIEDSSKKRKADIMQTIVNSLMNEKQARNYALGLGLSKEEAEEMALYAKAINSYSRN